MDRLSPGNNRSNGRLNWKGARVAEEADLESL